MAGVQRAWHYSTFLSCGVVSKHLFAMCFYVTENKILIHVWLFVYESKKYQQVLCRTCVQIYNVIALFRPVWKPYNDVVPAGVSDGTTLLILIPNTSD